MSERPDQLPDEIRALLLRARAQLEPSDERLERVRARVLQAARQPTERGPTPHPRAHKVPHGSLRWRLVFSSVVLAAGAALWLREVPRPRDSVRVERPSLTAVLDDAGLSKQPGPAASEQKGPASAEVTRTVFASSAAPEGGVRQASATPDAGAATRTELVPQLAARSDRGRAASLRDGSTAPGSRAHRGKRVENEDPFGPAYDLPSDLRASAPVALAEKGDRARAVSPVPAADTLVRSGAREARTTDQLAAEVALIAAAQRALERADYVEAERALREHAAQFPAGQLHAERVALATRARCLAHDGEGAKRLLRELELLTKQSALRRSVARACGALLSP